MTPNFIINYQFGGITIENRTYSSDVILLEKNVFPNWRRKKGHSLVIKDLEKVIDYKPELLIVGKGYYGYMDVPPQLTKKLEFQVISYKTQDAIKLYNQEIKKSKKISGAFHLSC